MRSSQVGLGWALLAATPASLGCFSSDGQTQSTDGGDASVADGSPAEAGPGEASPGEASPGDTGSDGPVGCSAPTGAGTVHGGGSSSDPDETWTAAASPHIIPFDHTIYSTVTIEPCAEVLIAGGATVTVRGKLVAEGVAGRPIHIGAKVAGTSFAAIRSLGATVRLAYATIDGGGAPLNTAIYLAGTLDLQGDNLKPTQELLFVDHVTVAGSASNGLVLRDGAGFAQGSTALTVTGSAAHPMSIFARSVGGIPVGSYTGNALDEILLPATSGNETMNETTTLHERGVPYLVGHATSAGDLRVDAPAGAPGVTLTIEPGVTMRFKKGGIFNISVGSSAIAAQGSLVAAGTAKSKIVFTSDEAAPAAGDWLGLRFGNVPTAADRVDFARVEYAGAASTSGSGSCPYSGHPTNDAALRVNGVPASQFVTNTEIVDSASNGIDRGWRSDNPVIDFSPTNTFTRVALCQETYPPTAGNVCPVPVPCP